MSIDLLVLMTSWVSDKFDYLMDNENFSLHFATFTAEFGWVCFFLWVGVGECGLFLAGCGWVWPFFGWLWVGVTFFWLAVGGFGWVWSFYGWVRVGVGECDLFLAGCGWVWPFFGWVWLGVIFFWLGKGGCDLFCAGCGWLWVSARFITAHFEMKSLFLVIFCIILQFYCT